MAAPDPKADGTRPKQPRSTGYLGSSQSDRVGTGVPLRAACRRTVGRHQGTRPRAFPVYTAPQWSAAAALDRRSSLRRSRSRWASRPRKTSSRGSTRTSSRTTACPCRQGRSGDLRSCRPVRRESRPTSQRQRPCAACSCRSYKGRCSSARLRPRSGTRRRRISMYGQSWRHPPLFSPKALNLLARVAAVQEPTGSQRPRSTDCVEKPRS